MRKLIFILALMVLGTVNAQKFARQSLEMGIGAQLYHDKLGNSRPGLSVQTSYRYMFTPTFGLQGAWQFDVTQSKDHPQHPECEYSGVSHHFRGELFKRIARFGRFTVNGSAGMGVSFYYLEQDARERVFNYTAAGSVFYSLGEKKNPWGFVKAEYRGIGNSAQDYTLNRNFETTSTPIQAFRQNITVGFGIYLDNAENKRHADWYKKRKVTPKCCEKEIVQDIHVHPQKIVKDVTLPYGVVFFEEGKSRIQDTYLPEVYRMVKWLKENPQYKVLIKSGSCTNQGSEERNRQLRRNRATAVFNKYANMGIDRKRMVVSWEENNTEYDGTNSDIQKIVESVPYLD